MPKPRPTADELEKVFLESDGRTFVQAARALVSRYPGRAARVAAERLQRTPDIADRPSEGLAFLGAYFCSREHIDTLFRHGRFGLTHFPWAEVPSRLVAQTLAQHRAEISTLDDDPARRLLRLWELWPGWFLGEPQNPLPGLRRWGVLAADGYRWEGAPEPRRIVDTQPYAPGPTVGHEHPPRYHALSAEENPTLHELLEIIALDAARAQDLRMAAVIQLGGFRQHLRLLPLLDDPLLTPELSLQIALETLVTEPAKEPAIQLGPRLERFLRRVRDASAEDAPAIAECGHVVQRHQVLPRALALPALTALAEDSRLLAELRQDAKDAAAALAARGG